MQPVLLRPHVVEDGRRDRAAQLRRAPLRHAPRSRGEEPGPEGVPDPGRVDDRRHLHGRHGQRLPALAPDANARRAVGGDPGADPAQHVRLGPAGLLQEESRLVLVGEQEPRPVHQLPHLLAVEPRQLLRRIGGEGNSQVTAGAGVPEHGLGVVRGDQDKVQPAGPRDDRPQVDLARLGHRPRVEGGDLVLGPVGRTDEPGGVERLADAHRVGVHAVVLQPDPVRLEVGADRAHESGTEPEDTEPEGDVRCHSAAPDLQVVGEERQGDPVEPVGEQLLAEPAGEGHQMVGGDGTGDSDTHGPQPSCPG